MGLVLEVVTLLGVGGEVNVVLLIEPKLPEGWVSHEGVTQVIIDPFWIYLLFLLFF